MSEFPWDHTDRFWGNGLQVSCSTVDARSLIAALSEALDELDTPRHQFDANETDVEASKQSRRVWRSAIDAGRSGDAGPGLSVSVTDQADAALEVTADMDCHAQMRGVIAAAVAGYDPSLCDADTERLVSADRDRIRTAIVDAQLPPDQIADIYRHALAAADATRDHRWVDAGFRYEARERSARRDQGRDNVELGLAAEDDGRQAERGWSL